METFNRIAPDVCLGRSVKIFGFANLYGCTVGDESRIGCFVEIQKNASVGARCKISSHSFICEGVTIEDDVFIGHHVCFINDLFPRASRTDGTLQTDADWKVIPILVKRRATIGSGAVILGGVTIGAGSHCRRRGGCDQERRPPLVVAGNPARLLRTLAEGRHRDRSMQRTVARGRARLSDRTHAATRQVKSAAARMAMIRVAVIGAGQWGPNLIRNFHNKQASEVVWIIDRDAARLDEVHARFPDVQAAEDPEQALRDPSVDAVVVATPTSTHYALAKEALERRKHVLVEKPLTTQAEHGARPSGACRTPATDSHGRPRVCL
jgi:acetyltransferase-like isoleucine patch superfamily enzyme